jgi:hypothetical protein
MVRMISCEGSKQMFHLLSFSGRWDASFFDNVPGPQQTVEQAERQKQATRAAVEARALFRLASKFHRLSQKTKCKLPPYEKQLVQALHNGTLQSEANRLTLISGSGRFKRQDGTFVDIGGSTGGFTRAVLYNWTPPSVD